MKKILLQFTFLLLCVFTLTSCFELREEVYIKKDGSGTYSLTVDLSGRKQEIAVTTSLTDSTNEEKNFVANIENVIQKSSESFSEIGGITHVEYNTDYENYLTGFSFDFDNVESLTAALNQLNTEPAPSKPAFEFSKRTFERNNTHYLQPLLDRAKERQKMAEDEATKRFQDYVFESANYVFIVRTEGKIKKYSNKKATYSSDDKNEVVLNYSFAELLSGRANLDNKMKIR
ncbi:MAG: hypothetical protein COZ18_01870 [Flexibacter sp. CG_4_10_14_3_um_filter_32_15]|nr:MAG: hypothetical protein COZ18_01870 [Flexibacter sp. CG_4_10_14_3_um_filter_32_15]